MIDRFESMQVAAMGKTGLSILFPQRFRIIFITHVYREARLGGGTRNFLSVLRDSEIVFLNLDCTSESLGEVLKNTDTWAHPEPF